MSYKRLGDYIQPVNIRNTYLEVTTLLGVSVKKKFIPSIANTVGTDFKKYKIVKKHQFVYIPDTSRRGEKIGIAMLESHNIALVSQAYTVFEIENQKKLLSEYLMMWFRRPEFDRYARIKSHGSVREVFDWEELCDTQLPIPSLEKQQQIVAEYNTVAKRIKLNEQLNQKLEETAQALYKHWFVDFEFPNVDGKPYKSSGGEMVYNEELDKDIPVGWSVERLGEIIESHSKKHDFKKEELIFFNTSDILEGDFLHNNYMKVEEMPGQAKKTISKNDILYSEIRPANKRYALVRIDSEDYVVSTKLMVLRLLTDKFNSERIYHYLIYPETIKELHQAAEGRSGTFPQITFEEHIENRQLIIASDNIEKKWQAYLTLHFEQFYNQRDENKKLKELQSLLLAKMTKVELININ
ncbi:restriction endonuclease subunit S [Polaribacter butkevichii]|uniref:Type I restriction modification DNA specificity domain-containing protein n=1 Tax=Polaribacter butkevichii TaxID=218490 RepID=A0A2P6CCX8_9FLAO|nr:restriction endonuclease subunit S [Polaribacter butkevichii]PQJ72761.1 hypothetical protein BTO14_05595 [Polaribacter butkevichii]